MAINSRADAIAIYTLDPMSTPLAFEAWSAEQYGKNKTIEQYVVCKEAEAPFY